MKPFDLSLYLIVDPSYCQRPFMDIVALAIENGATMIQYRDKTANKIELMERARKLRKYLFAKKIPLIINDYLDLAMTISADGVHVGQTDSNVITIRKRWGRNKILGLSIEHPDQMQAEQLIHADYLGVGPIFTTTSKPDAATAMGIENLKICRGKTDLPIVAIGGITLENIPVILQTQVNGIAVISAICSHTEPGVATRELATAIKSKFCTRPSRYGFNCKI